LFVPIVGEANALPFVQRLELSIAGRWEDYSDFGTTTNPKIGVIWSPVAGLDLRATYGTSFRAPSLVDSADQIKNIFLQNLTDPTSGTGVTRGVFYNGGNSGLGPETATTWSGGFDWKPTFLDGFSLSSSYYRIEYENRIDVAPVTALTAGSVYSNFFIRRPAAADVAGNCSLRRPGRLLHGQPGPAEPGRADIQHQRHPRRSPPEPRHPDPGRGRCLAANYAFDTSYGDWRVGLDIAKILTVDRQGAPGTPVVDVLDTFGNPVDLRVRGSLGWHMDGWSANAFANYTDSYLNTAITPNVMVDSLTTYDLTASYQFEGEGWTDGVRVSVNALNVFDEDPPIVLNGTVSWDSQAASAIGRFISFEISKAW
jgi:iron complex outermembrane receptor protein